MTKTPASALAVLLLAALLPSTSVAENPASKSAAPFTRDAVLLERADSLVREARRSLRDGNGSGNGSGAGAARNRAIAAREVVRFVVLSSLFPDGEPAFTMELAAAVADLPEDEEKADGMAEGRQVAGKVLSAYGF